MLNGRHTNPTPGVYKVYKVFFLQRGGAIT